MKKYKVPASSFLASIILVLVFLSVYSCNKKTGMGYTINTAALPPDSVAIMPHDTVAVVPHDTIKTYLALGDSYTIGQSVTAPERFPNQTVQLLRSNNIKINDPEIIAVTGWTTANLINALDQNLPQNNYAVVTLLIGVNNQYQHRSIDEYKTEFTLLLNRSIQYAGNIKSHVFVLSIPDYSVTPFASGSDRAAIAKEIDQFNAVNKTISEQSGVNYLDITPISREALNDPLLIAKDGLHPSGTQYKRWADLLAPLIKKEM